MFYTTIRQHLTRSLSNVDLNIFLDFQDVEVSGDKDDSRSLHITIHKPATSSHARPIPLLSAKFVFDDHIRCMAAKQRLTKGRLRARQRKMQMIARLLELPSAMVDTMYQPQAAAYPLPGYRANNQSFPGMLDK